MRDILYGSWGNRATNACSTGEVPQAGDGIFSLSMSCDALDAINS
jgi:hypothetical protein